jgi:hypothetical protein
MNNQFRWNVQINLNNLVVFKKGYDNLQEVGIDTGIPYDSIRKISRGKSIFRYSYLSIVKNPDFVMVKDRPKPPAKRRRGRPKKNVLKEPKIMKSNDDELIELPDQKNVIETDEIKDIIESAK